MYIAKLHVASHTNIIKYIRKKDVTNVKTNTGIAGN